MSAIYLCYIGSQRLVMSWDIPKCSPGCSDAWIGDGYCDKACNNSACNFDYPDCINSTNHHHHHHHGSSSSSGSHSQSNPMNLCQLGCPDSWLGDRICDQRCKNEACGWDLGDCGLDLITSTYPGVAIDELNSNIIMLLTSSSSSSLSSPSSSSSSLNGDDNLHHHLQQQQQPQDDHGNHYHHLNESISESNDSQQSRMNSSNDDGIRSSNNNSSSSSSIDGHSTRVDYNNRNSSYLETPSSSLSPTPSSSLSSSSSSSSSLVSPPSSSSSSSSLPSSSYIAPTLSVAYGTKAVYFDLAYLACLYHDSNNNSNNNNYQGNNNNYQGNNYRNKQDDIIDSSTNKLIPTICDLSQLDYTLFTYEDASHNDDSRVIVHSATILRRHFLFMVLLFHGQYDMPPPAVLPVDVKFRLKFKYTPTHNIPSSSSSPSSSTASSSSSLSLSETLPQTTEATFSLRVFDSKSTTATTIINSSNNSSISNITSGMSLMGIGDVIIPPYMHRISSSFAHTCSNQVY